MKKDIKIISISNKDSLGEVIPKNWEIKTLNDVCDFLDTQRIPIKDTDRTKIPGIYPYYGASGIIDYVNKYIFDDDLILLAEDGANIINRSTPIAYLVNGKIWVNNHAHVLKTKSTIDRYYLCAYLESLKYDKYNTGTAQPKLNRETCEKIPVLMPPLFEQQKIANILNTWDKAIEKQTRLVEKLELRKKGLMQQLLTGKKRLPGFSGEWKKVKLGEIGIFFKGFGVSKDEIKSYERYKCLTYGDIYTKYEIKIENVRSFISQDVANISKQIQYGDICFASSGETAKDIGKCAVFVDGSIGYAGGDIIIFRNKTNVNPITLAYILNSEEVNKQKSSLGQGHSVVHIYIPNLEKITIKIPDIEEQNAITEIFTSCDKEIYLANQKLKSLHQQKKGLMQVLLTGKKRVTQ